MSESKNYPVKVYVWQGGVSSVFSALDFPIQSVDELRGYLWDSATPGELIPLEVGDGTVPGDYARVQFNLLPRSGSSTKFLVDATVRVFPAPSNDSKVIILRATDGEWGVSLDGAVSSQAIVGLQEGVEKAIRLAQDSKAASGASLRILKLRGDPGVNPLPTPSVESLFGVSP